ncbi:restriction endonuclease subunit S [Clostridium sp. ZS2-4]|uniref:restriction endonuclease subunit S n=1 Tax=Clostridium sp. ZS2-4 TaxID=2987703 RepID=UPI00227BD1F0|nr:restriction endonuclease subunit S [Clostridium sp. ZS2-4]MCY6356610.1 restriction endonuclease subunit S [Clostridium sp. ZS2-4]
MKLNINEWKEFKVSLILTIMNGKGITKQEIENHEGEINVVQSGEDNNGVLGKIDLDYCKEMGYTYTEKPCLTVARSGSAGFVSFQVEGCVVGDSAKILLLDDSIATTNRYLFIKTLLTANRFKYAYGRKVTETNYMNDVIKLPVVKNEDGTYLIDTNKKYSNDGYVPDWDWMNSYIESLNNTPLTTTILPENALSLDTSTWKEFYLHKLFDTKMGNGIDAQNTTTDEPKYNYVSRNSNGNGVVGYVDEIEGEEPFPAGAMSLALGGSFLGSCFMQTAPFYTAQNVGILQERENLSSYVKLFIATLIRNECKIKYQAFGRELNAHFRKDFTIKLPVKKNSTGCVIDKESKYSDDGHMPDWEWIEEYMKSLPYSDRIK